MDDPACGDVDGISALPDSVLHVILGCLEDAPAVTKTAILSRRWRHVWTGARNLTFKNSHLVGKAGFAGFVDWVLAQRGEHAKIHLAEKGSLESPEQLNAWLRYDAVRHAVKSVEIDLGYWAKQDKEVLVEVPSGRADSIFLVLPGHRLQFPAARYEALTNLQLISPSLDEDGRALCDFVASCCHRLRRLRLCCPGGLRQLVLRSEVLQEFAILSALELQTLDVATPNLRVFELSQSFTYQKIEGNNNKLARIVAPKLEEIVSMHYFRATPTDFDIHDLKSVRRLSQLYLDMHSKYHQDMDVGFWLLENCPSVEHIEIWLHHMPRKQLELVDMTSEGKAPFPKLN